MKAVTFNKKIYLNLKRFDIPRDFGGINDIGSKENYGIKIASNIEKMELPLEVTIFMQEVNLLPALSVSKNIKIGCQGVHFEDAKVSGPFGAYTTFRTASSMKAIGVNDCLIGHCEERNYLNKLTNNSTSISIDTILNEEVKRATELGMRVLFCVGEKDFEQPYKHEVLKRQLEVGLKDVDLSLVTVAYEPVWAIGPGKTPPDDIYIKDIVKFIKTIKDVKVVYGGGLKKENAKMLASIEELDGGLIALTRFGKDFGFYLEDFKEIVDTYTEGLK